MMVGAACQRATVPLHRRPTPASRLNWGLAYSFPVSGPQAGRRREKRQKMNPFHRSSQ